MDINNSRRNLQLSDTGGLETVLEADANLTAGSPLNVMTVKRHDLLLMRGKEYQDKKK